MRAQFSIAFPENPLNAELIEVYKSLDFEGFFQLFKDGIDHCCKLAKPKYSKRNPINNPWITDGIIDAIEHKNDLYIDWIRTKSSDSDPGNRNLYEKFSKYRYCLKKIIKDQKSIYYKNKISQCCGDIKKTWEIINQLRGKSKKSIKPCLFGGWDTCPPAKSDCQQIQPVFCFYSKQT